MNNPQLTTRVLGDLILASQPECLDIVGRAALYAASRELTSDIKRYIDESCEGDAYALEKVSLIRHHIEAALSFGSDNGQSAEQHRVWALGALSSLKSHLGWQR